MDWLVAILMVTGMFFAFVASLGLVRMPDLYTRIHAATKAGAFGSSVILFAAALHFGSLRAAIMAVLVVVSLSVAIGCSGNRDYDEEVRDAFLTNCEYAGSTPSICISALECIEERLTQSDFEYEETPYHLEINKGGYVFSLDRPVHVEVLEGRVRGDRELPIEHPIPRFDKDRGAYMLPDGGAVIPQADGRLVPTEPPPLPDAGLDGGLDGGVAPSADTAPVPPPVGTTANPAAPAPQPTTAVPTGALSPVALPTP